MKRLFPAVLLLFFFPGLCLAEVASPPQPSAVTLDNLFTKLKLKGRAAIGYFNSEKDASFRSGSVEVPDAKLQFIFSPAEKVTLTARFNVNNSGPNTPLVDYLFLESKNFISGLNGRVGRFKLGVGEETWANNPIEGVLPSNSAANIDGVDEGVELSGKFWVLSVSNGSRGLNAESGQAKAWMGKLFYSPIDPLYLSVTYYDSESLKASQSEVSIAGLTTSSAGAPDWSRRVWEGDLRFDFGKGTKPLYPLSFSDSKAFVRLSYGQFKDEISNVPTRRGQIGFVDGIYNCTQKIYIGGRVSFINLDGSNTTASLNGIRANHYERYSLGLGYRLSDNIHLKAGYDHNENGGAGTQDASDDLASALFAVRL